MRTTTLVRTRAAVASGSVAVKPAADVCAIVFLRLHRQQAPHAEGVRLCAVAWRSAQQGERSVQQHSSFYLNMVPPTVCPRQVAVYAPGSKGAPSFVRLYQYPAFGGPTAALANKSFFKADRVMMQWNKKGRCPESRQLEP